MRVEEVHERRAGWRVRTLASRRWRSRVAATSLLFACIALPSHAEPLLAIDDLAWRVESSNDGITLYRATARRGGVVPLKATMTIRGTIEEVSLVLEDIPRRTEWISNLGQSVLLERVNDYDQTEYLRVAVPWPVSDRSALIRARITVSDDFGQATIAAQSVDVAAPDSLPKLVRAIVHTSTFQMTKVDDRVEVVALVFIDPCGTIPKWIVNFFARRVARATLGGLRRQVARKLYSRPQIAAMHERMHAFRAFRERQLLTR